MIAGTSQVHERGLDLLQLHVPAGRSHSSRGGQGVTPPHSHTTAHPSLSRAPPPADHHLPGHAMPAPAIHSESGQTSWHPQTSGSHAPPQQHANNAAVPLFSTDHAAHVAAAEAACPQVQFGVFTNLASGSAFMGPSKMSAAACKAMSSFASDDAAAAPAIQKTAGGPSGSWQQATSFACSGTRAVHATREMEGTGNKQAPENPGHAHQQPLSGRCHQSQGQPANCMPPIGAAVMNPAANAATTAAATAAESTSTNQAADPAGLTNPDIAGPLGVHAATIPAAGSAAAKAGGDSDAAGGCPPVQFGVFTNLKSNSMWAPPGKWSEKAKKRAKEVFPDVFLEVPAAAPAAVSMGQAQLAQQQLGGLQPAATAHVMRSGMLCPSSCQKTSKDRSGVFCRLIEPCMKQVSFTKCTNALKQVAHSDIVKERCQHPDTTWQRINFACTGSYKYTAQTRCCSVAGAQKSSFKKHATILTLCLVPARSGC